MSATTRQDQVVPASSRIPTVGGRGSPRAVASAEPGVSAVAWPSRLPLRAGVAVAPADPPNSAISTLPSGGASGSQLAVIRSAGVAASSVNVAAGSA
jgi:hypothetical protein